MKDLDESGLQLRYTYADIGQPFPARAGSFLSEQTDPQAVETTDSVGTQLKNIRGQMRLMQANQETLEYQLRQECKQLTQKFENLAMDIKEVRLRGTSSKEGVPLITEMG